MGQSVCVWKGGGGVEVAHLSHDRSKYFSSLVISLTIGKCILLEAQNCFLNYAIFIFHKEEVPVISLSLVFDLRI